MWCVYKHTSPSRKVYIGITHQKPELRWRSGKGYRSNKRFWSAIKKYGWDSFEHEILFDNLTQEEAERLEKKLVLEYDSANHKCGYNVAEGGHVLSPESRKRIGDTRRERKIHPWCQGKHMSDETKAKLSAAMKGKRNHTEWTDEEKEKVRQSKLGKNNPNFGKGMTEEQKRLLLLINEKPVECLSDEGVKAFRSAKSAGKALGITPGNITRVCKGQRQTAGGYRWRYKVDEWGRVTATE